MLATPVMFPRTVMFPRQSAEPSTIVAIDS